MRYRSQLFLTAFALLCLATSVLHAQDPPSPGGPPPKSKAPSAAQQTTDDQAQLKISVNLVNTYISVRDKNGYVTSLRKDDCQVIEDHVEQKIKNFTQEKNVPLTIGILLDTSGSMQNVLPLEQDAGARFLKEIMTAKDEAFLISFDVNVDLLADYTSSPRELERAIRKAQINSASSSAGVPGIGGGPVPIHNPRGTLLYDAVYLAAREKMRPEAGRKVVVILSDGEDQGSQETLKTSIEAAQKSNALVYVILIADRGFYGGFGYSGEASMNKLANETGARLINVGNNGRKLEDAFDQINDELRTQYLLSYTPTNTKLDGTFRNLQISCGQGLKVQSRKGYYATNDTSPD